MHSFKTVFLCGLATLLLAAILGMVLPSYGNLSADYKTPIIAFEFARSSSDLSFLVGLNQATNNIRSAMAWGLYIDFLFPIAYAGFLLSVWNRITVKSSALLKLGAVICALIVILDFHENGVMLALLNQASTNTVSESTLDWLYVATWAKWLMIATMIGMLSVRMIDLSRFVTAAIGCAVVAVSIICVANDTPPALAEIMAQAVGIFFAILLLSEIRVWWQLRGMSSR